MAVEKRCHPRVEISWPVTVVTDEGIISGRAENLSFVGTLIRCSEILELLYDFRLVFRPAELQFLVTTAERVWSSTIISNNSASHLMGVRFTYIPEHERRVFSRTIFSHTRSQQEDYCFEKIRFHKFKCSHCRANLLMKPTVKRCPVCGSSSLSQERSHSH
jgi:DNA-directed RNA polymerase subunit RPC12/RpoP/c-di-GMP-binding flagellar brake protein YcgR